MSIDAERLELRDTFAAALADYRERRRDKSAKGFRDCQTILPNDAANHVFLDRITQLQREPLAGGWNGVWLLTEK